MNRRQKMKRMKQELEWYKKQMVPTREVGVDMRQTRVETLRAEKVIVSNDPLEVLPPEEYIFSQLNKMLLNELQKYIIYNRKIGPWLGPLPEKFIYTAELKVVVPYGGDRI